MARPFEFTPAVRRATFRRQDGRCACCGDHMAWRDDDIHAHHVVPNQSGDTARASDDFLRREDNCVYLCTECHWAVHEGGRYRNGAVPGPDYYPYSHGARMAEHALWAQRLKSRSGHVWQRLVRASGGGGGGK